MGVLATAVVAGGGVARAEPGAPEPGPVVAGVQTFTDWTAGPRDDLPDQGIGRYQFETQVVGGARRAAASAERRYTPERMTDPATLRVELAELYDDVLHNRPNPPDNPVQEVGHPDLLPDWDADGTYGEPEDYDVDVDVDRDAAWFRYPVFGADGSIDHVPDREGVAVEAGFVNSRGLFVDATLWLPGDRLTLDGDTVSYPAALAARPGLVFSNGLSSRQEEYYWFAEAMVARGYVVMTYDPVGQGESDGTWSDLFQQGTGTDCQFGGACLDVQDAVRWFTAAGVAARPDLQGFEDGQLRPLATQVGTGAVATNPFVALVDTGRVGIAGNSMGALSTLNYLHFLEADADLPALKAAVAMSGATETTAAAVPLQLQTSDFDGSPTLLGPTVGGAYLGQGGEGIGYYPIKGMFDRLVADDDNDLSLVVLKGGVHTDHVRTPFVTRTRWATYVAEHYAGAWFDCYIAGSAAACDQTRQPVSDPSLSRAFGSEHYAAASTTDALTCIGQAPTEISLNYDPEDLAAARPRDCHGRAS